MTSGTRLRDRAEPPSLDPPFDEALLKALDFLDDVPEPVVGLWLAGSVSRGEGDANSDLDLYVLVDAVHRRRIQRVLAGVPVEMFLNPPRRARQYFDEDRSLGRTPSLDMMARGLILLDPLGECAAIAKEAQAAIAGGPAVPEAEIEVRRYRATDKLDNAADVARRDPTTARLLASGALHEATILWFITQGDWAPRDKDLLPALRNRHLEAAAAVDAYGATGDIATARQAMRYLIGVAEFYEWASPPDPA